MSISLPKYDQLFNPLLVALHQLGNSASISELEEKVAEIINLSDEDINQPHGKSGGTEFGYRMAWSRTYLKQYGVLDNSSRGIWSLTEKGLMADSVDEKEVVNYVRSLRRKETTLDEEVDEGNLPGESRVLWQEELLEQILSMSPDAFEKLCQRILRESGFIQVEVTGRSGDGGIDGRGIFRMAGLVSFRVLFQAKRYKGSISAKHVRDFRGAITGRADKGIFVTTGSFTRDAKKEATRDGAPIIDLIDGGQLVELMKNLGLGVRISTEEVIEVDVDWFPGK